jgi:SAM-dependent methyltransferase
MAARFVARSPECRAWGVDLDRKTLDWGARHRVALLGEDAGRVTLVEGDVRTVRVEPVDVAAAFNFSYWIFRDRAGLGRYLRHVYSGLADGGVLVLDAFGGTESMCEAEERTRIPASRDPAGWKIPSFTYVWDQHRFNPIDHALQCFIHFELKDGTQIRRAFRYDWRFWTLPELQELLLEVGFAEVKVYVEGWDEESDEPDGIFRHRRYFENDGGWLAYLAAFKI